MLISSAIGAGLGLAFGIFAAAWYAFAYIIRTLADRDVLVTYPMETMAKAIMLNGRIHRLVMAFRGYCFAGDLDPTLPSPEKWDVVPGNVTVGSRLPLIRGIRWVGLPPFSNVYRYRFSWASLEEQSLNEDLAKKPVFSEKEIDYIFLRSDVYVTKIEKAECADNIPLDAVILIGGRIVNPYKALFGVERWLEASINVIDSRMRSFFGCKTYVELRSIAEALHSGPGATEYSLSIYFKEVMEQIKEKWGFEISFIQIYSVDPGSDLADEFIRSTTLVYVAQQQRDANMAEGDGLAARDKKHYGAIQEISGGTEFFKWDAIARSKLTTYVEGGDSVRPSIPIGTTADRPATPTREPADHTPA